jgi:ring-1,2-phenylacetyl-CoA epoxidase subunit PaaE
MSQFHRLAIADLRRETEDCVSLAFAVPDHLAPRFSFMPGQYLTLRTELDGVEIRRSYSICAGLDDSELRVAIKHVPGGLFSSYATQRLQIGDLLDVMPPAGRFGTMIQAESARLCLGIAAGSGITPILSILKSLLMREPNSRFVLLYGSRSTRSILFREQLEDLKDRFMGRLSVQHVLSREQQDVPVLSGRLDAPKLAQILPGLIDLATVDAAFICGPGTMIDSAAATLKELGVPQARVHTERFTPATQVGPRPLPTDSRADMTAPTHTAVIIHEGRSTEIDLAADETILDAALRAGLDLPWSCRAGMCSTCRARVTAGEAEMGVNFSLESWETEQGYVLTCQARPLSAQCVVDFDQM